MINWFKGLSSNAQVGLAMVPLALIVFGVSAAKAPDTKQITNTNTKTQQSEPKITTKMVDEEQQIPFSSSTVESNSMPKGTSKVTTPGVNGKQIVSYEIIYKDGVEQSKTEKSARVIVQPVNRVTTVGTYVAPPPPPAPAPAPRASSNCDPNYSPCIPNVSYDLDCPDIGRRVSVIGYDKHRLDRDGDGVGCESY